MPLECRATTKAAGLVSAILKAGVGLRSRSKSAMIQALLKGLTFEDIPAEIIHEILLLLPQASVLKFGLTCRRAFGLCLPALHRKVILTAHNVVSFNKVKFAQNDPYLILVRELQLGRRGEGHWSSETPWDVLSNDSVLPNFPNLRSLNALHHEPMRGWTGLLYVLEILPPSTIKLVGSMACRADLGMWPVKRPFPSYKTLHLYLTVDSLVGHHPGESRMAPNLSFNFPNLVHLVLALPQLIHDLDLFLKSSYFPFLTTFSLASFDWQWGSTYLSSTESRGMVAFLSHHAGTLRELDTPTWTVDDDSVSRFSEIELRLHRVRACIHLTTILGQSRTFASTLSSLDLIWCCHGALSIPRTAVLSVTRICNVPAAVFPGHRSSDAGLARLLELVPNLRILRVKMGQEDQMKKIVARVETSSVVYAMCPKLRHVFFVPPDQQEAVYAIVREPSCIRIRDTGQN
ncbi:hypothetical protein C8Q79DRAFT_262024 [Trametes meyenii]|nr:hypothetical protein C8Q79DRAFT_262024 [Trametes meyenii]